MAISTLHSPSPKRVPGGSQQNQQHVLEQWMAPERHIQEAAGTIQLGSKRDVSSPASLVFPENGYVLIKRNWPCSGSRAGAQPTISCVEESVATTFTSSFLVEVINMKEMVSEQQKTETNQTKPKLLGFRRHSRTKAQKTVLSWMEWLQSRFWFAFKTVILTCLQNFQKSKLS